MIVSFATYSLLWTMATLAELQNSFKKALNQTARIKISAHNIGINCNHILFPKPIRLEAQKVAEYLPGHQSIDRNSGSHCNSSQFSTLQS
jgi:hypothetical protein